MHAGHAARCGTYTGAPLGPVTSRPTLTAVPGSICLDLGGCMIAPHVQGVSAAETVRRSTHNGATWGPVPSYAPSSKPPASGRVLSAAELEEQRKEVRKQKNRDSAAATRARREAYTASLEGQVQHSPVPTSAQHAAHTWRNQGSHYCHDCAASPEPGGGSCYVTALPGKECACGSCSSELPWYLAQV